jgi:hypothetical protein
LKFVAFFLFLVCLPLAAEEEIAGCISDYYCNDVIPQTRSDNIPQTHITDVSDEFLTGYLQALIDMHYYEFQVKVIVQDGIAYLFYLPNNELLAESIIGFIHGVPCIVSVERMDCLPEDYFYSEPECATYYDSMCSPCADLSGIWFPQSTVLFAPLIADPRQVTNSAALRFNDDVVGKHVGAISFGDDFPIYRWLDVFWWHGDLQLDIEAGIFAVFDLDHPSACMFNTDFFVALMPTYAVDRWSYRFRLWHLSSHVGDEFLLANPNFDRCNVSDEGVDFFASYQFCRPIRIYGGIGYIITRDREFPEGPLYFECGAEVRAFGCRDCYNKLYIQPFLAMHFRSWEEHSFSIDQTYALGVEWSKIQGVGRRFRLFMEYHDGFSKEGQFVREKTNYMAIRMTYGF